MKQVVHLECSFECSNTKGSSISIYPGLLLWYMMQWQVKPNVIISCNEKPIKVCTDFHIYATIKLQIAISSFDFITKLNMSIVGEEEAIETVTDIEHSSQLPTMSATRDLQIGELNTHSYRDYIYNQFDYIDYNGSSNTVRFDQVHGPVSNGSESYCRDTGQVNPWFESENGKSLKGVRRSR